MTRSFGQIRDNSSKIFIIVPVIRLSKSRSEYFNEYITSGIILINPKLLY